MAKFNEKYRQSVIKELSEIEKAEKVLRLSFSPGTESYFQIMAIANQKARDPRAIVEVAIRCLYYAIIGAANEPAN